MCKNLEAKTCVKTVLDLLMLLSGSAQGQKEEEQRREKWGGIERGRQRHFLYDTWMPKDKRDDNQGRRRST